MKKILFLTGLLLLIFGCTITIDVQTNKGNLKVINSTVFDVTIQINNETPLLLHPSETAEKSWDLTSGEVITVDLSYWTTISYQIDAQVVVTSGETTTYQIDESDGTLRIVNDTSSDVWYSIDNGTEQTVLAGNSDSWSWDLLVNEMMFTTVDYSGNHVFSNTETKTIVGGQLITMDVIPDGGAIEILNDSDTFIITQVYLSPSNSSDWGDDDLTGNINPGNSQIWTVVPAYWDIWVVDDWGDNFYSYQNYINLDETSTFSYTGFRKGDRNSENIKQNEYKKFPATEDKVELK